MRRRLLGVGIAAALAASTLLAVPAGAATLSTVATVRADDGATVVQQTLLGPRTVDLTVASPAVGTAHVRLLLPKDWSARPDLRWPTLYLFNGVDALDYQSWTHYTDVAAFTADKNVLVAMPDAGPAASYTDEYAVGARGPQWETFHTRELPQLLQRGYRSNGSNAVAGLSAGGFGALAYTLRHPGLYRATASYSGLTDLFDPPGLLARLGTRLQAGGNSGPNPWAALLANVVTSPAHNPQSNPLAFVRQPLYLSCGMGFPGPLDSALPDPAAAAYSRGIESAAYEMNARFAATVQLFGGRPTTHFYAGGLHYWPYWQRELKASWPLLSTAMGGPTP